MYIPKPFPRTLYKSNPEGTQVLASAGKRYRYDSLVVNNDTELGVAEEMGYIDDFHDALFGIPEAPKEEQVLPKRQRKTKVSLLPIEKEMARVEAETAEIEEF